MPVVWRGARQRGRSRARSRGDGHGRPAVAVQAAKLLGAKHVVAAGRGPRRLERGRRARRGRHRQPRGGGGGSRQRLQGRRRAATGPRTSSTRLREPAVAATQAARPGWRLVQIGQSAGAEGASRASAAVRGKMGEIYGFTDFAVPRDVFREHYLRLVRQRRRRTSSSTSTRIRWRGSRRHGAAGRRRPRAGPWGGAGGVARGGHRRGGASGGAGGLRPAGARRCSQAARASCSS